ncbi:MAG: quinone-dependent dihydroorotate dehydrogenase [Chitinophagaceae bacterium]|nr:quinone-dependent dihydroorotate dehydrogenase [Chitinophagaceae bacterium]
MYKVLRNILFLFPAEWVHYFSMNFLRLLTRIGLRPLITLLYRPLVGEHSPTNVAGLDFKNPVGLGAGFDKNAKYLPELEALGFGCVEIGTVTPFPQFGNAKPRLFRLAKDKALINRMGFNNDGVKAITARLKQWREAARTANGKQRPLIVGGNIGKNKITANQDAWKDYDVCFRELHPYVDYFTVNVSSPNTPGLRELQEKESLRKILLHLQMINNGKASPKPIFLKIAPDLGREQIDDVIDLAQEIKLDGLVATNTTISRDGLAHCVGVGNQEGGGLSGLPLKNKSTEIVRYISQKTNGEVTIVASGGIFTGADAREKLDAGASLVQVWTGFIYEGPAIVKKIMNSLRRNSIGIDTK